MRTEKTDREHRRSESEVYDSHIFDMVVKLAPIIGLCAAAVFTVARLCGFYESTNLWGLVSFDILSCIYVLIAAAFGIKNRKKAGGTDSKLLLAGKCILTFFIVLQWNMISYLFPTRDFWGYASLFVFLILFFFDSRLVLANEIGIAVSIIISWLLKGEQLLPEPGPEFEENLILRCVALILIFICMYLICRNGEDFKKKVDAHQQALEEQNGRLVRLNSGIVRFAADVVDDRDPYSGTHVKRIEAYVRILTEYIRKNMPEYGLTETDTEMIAEASTLHDIGKIYVPDSILLKQEPLTAEEFEILKLHTINGTRVLDSLPEEMDPKFLRYGREICLFHHERCDGSGYPSGIAGDDIPLAAQITALADCFDALTEERPYEAAIPPEKAYEMIINGECGAFSDIMIKVFSDCRNELVRAARRELKLPLHGGSDFE